MTAQQNQERALDLLIDRRGATREGALREAIDLFVRTGDRAAGDAIHRLTDERNQASIGTLSAERRAG